MFYTKSQRRQKIIKIIIQKRDIDKKYKLKGKSIEIKMQADNEFQRRQKSI